MRPKIICHILSSIDGRLLVGRWTRPAPGIDPSVLEAHYEACASTFRADGWIVGRATMAAYAHGAARDLPSSVSAERPTSHIGDRRDRSLAVVIDPHGKLHYGGDHVGGDHVVAMLGDQVSDAYLTELRADGVSYFLAGADGIDLNGALENVGAAFGVSTLLLEGGGRTNGTFLKAGLIDEISVLFHPGVDGLSGVPSIFEYGGTANERPAGDQSLRHLATETLEGGMVWVRYEVVRSSRS